MRGVYVNGIGDGKMVAISRFCRSERAVCWGGERAKKSISHSFPFISDDSSRTVSGFWGAWRLNGGVLRVVWTVRWARFGARRMRCLDLGVGWRLAYEAVEIGVFVNHGKDGSRVGARGKCQRLI